MALTISDVQDLLAILRENAEWRDAVLRALLPAEFLALPQVVRDAQARTDARFAEMAAAQAHTDAKLVELAEVVARLSQEISRLGGEVSRLGGEVSRLGGRVGNLEGGAYEQRYREHIGSRLGKRLRRAEPVSLGHEARVLDALDRGELSDREWDELTALDLVVKGRKGPGEAAPEYFMAIEISLTIDRRDVVRASERAALLRRIGLTIEAAVGGRTITTEARETAAELGVVLLLDHADD